jgi:hypothetical protein
MRRRRSVRVVQTEKADLLLATTLRGKVQMPGLNPLAPSNGLKQVAFQAGLHRGDFLFLDFN